MNTSYTLTKSGVWWQVRDPRGKNVAAYLPGRWPEAVAQAHYLSTLDQIRDQKHDELFQRHDPTDGLRATVTRMRDAMTRTRAFTQNDYALAN